MATTSWQVTGRSNTTCTNTGGSHEGTGNNYNTYGAFNVISNTTYLQAGKVTQLTYRAYHSRNKSTSTNITATLNWNNGTSIAMGTQKYAFSGNVVNHTYTVNFTETSTPNCYEVAAAVRSGLKNRYITYSPADKSSDLLYFRGTSDQPITVTATYETFNPIHYYHDNAWENCCAYYYDGTNWVLCNPYYYNGSGFQNLG